MPKLAEQTTSLCRRSDRPQAKRGAILPCDFNHHPPRLQARPTKAHTRPPLSRSAANLATVLHIIIAARSGAARHATSSCWKEPPTLPARQPQRGRTCHCASYHHCRAEQRGQTKRQQLLERTDNGNRPAPARLESHTQSGNPSAPMRPNYDKQTLLSGLPPSPFK